MIVSRNIKPENYTDYYFDGLVLDTVNKCIYFKNDKGQICRQEGVETQEIITGGQQKFYLGEYFIDRSQPGFLFIVGLDNTILKFKGRLESGDKFCDYGDSYTITHKAAEIG